MTYSANTVPPHGLNGSNPKPVKTGVLLTNLGTPDAPTTRAVRRYLAEFLSDSRVVGIPKLIWLVILHGIILRIRPARSAKLYQSIWTESGSPLLSISRRQHQKLQELVQQKHPDVVVELAMRYGNPSISEGLKKLRAQGVQRLIIQPLYPQYSAPTTGSTFDAVARELQTWRWVPELHFINNYCDNPLYIEALAASVREHTAEHGLPDKLLVSYHGMPQQYFTDGDPYYCYCLKTSRLLREALGLTDEQVVTCFQSRFGKAQWLQPYTDMTLKGMAEDGVQHVAILSPAFSADCLETLEELEVENRDVFMQAGGKTYHYIAALNDRPDHIAAVYDSIASYLK